MKDYKGDITMLVNGYQEDQSVQRESQQENENVKTSNVDMLEEYVYNDEDDGTDLAPELNVDENIIFLPAAGENDDFAIPFSASEFLQEEKEVIDTMETHIMDDEDESLETRSNRRSPDCQEFHSHVPKKRRNVISTEYEPEDKILTDRKKRRGRKPGSKVVNGQVCYPEEDGLTHSKHTQKGTTKGSKVPVRPTSRQMMVEFDDSYLDENQCRVCTSPADLFSIFRKEYTKTFADKLMAICSTVIIQRKDFLPQYICQICASSICSEKQCEQTDTEFRDRLKNSVKNVKRLVSTSYILESEPEEYVKLDNDQEFKPPDASPPSTDVSDSRPTCRWRNAKSLKKKSGSASPAMKRIKSEANLNSSKSSELDGDMEGGDLSSGSKEDNSPSNNRGQKQFIVGDGVTCRVCNETLSSRDALREHKKIVHSHYECELCGREFDLQSSLKAHRDKHTQASELKCEQHFPNKTEHRKHMVDVHNEATAQFVCKRAFRTEDRLMKHYESRCTDFDTSQIEKRVDVESLAMGNDLFKCVAPLTTTYWSDSYSD